MERRIMVMAAWIGALLVVPLFGALAQTAPLSLTVSNSGVKTLRWPLVPGLDTLELKTGQSLNNTLSPVPSGLIGKTPSGYVYTTSNQFPSQFFTLRLGQMSQDAVATANLLNRIAYGPTPDELERLTVIGPDQYIDEQLAPENIAGGIDSYSSVTTNGVPMPPNVWTFLTVTGSVPVNQSSLPFYMYVREVTGQASVDSVEFYYMWTVTAITNQGGVRTTNVYPMMSTNMIVNGDFEAPLGAEWAFDGTSHDGSFRDVSTAATGSASMRLVATAPGTGSGNSVRQTLGATPRNTGGTNVAELYGWTNIVSRVQGLLKFAYFPSPNSHYLTLRITGDSTIGSGRDEAEPPEWVYTTVTGPASSSTLYIYLDGAGDGYVDDLKLVAGSEAEAGPNLLVNGDFEQPLSTGWSASADFINSYVDNTVSHSGGSSLHIVATAAGSTANDSISQAGIPVTVNQPHTLSYWYRPATRGRRLTIRLSGSGIVSSPDTLPGAIKRRLENADFSASLDDMRAWFCQNAVGSPRQLLEVLTQFFENHFVTQHSKTSDYFDRYYDGLQNQVATDLEYREVSRWRAALMNQNCTFYDLLKIHVESPAQIIYLDTIDSRGDGNNVANENYARELFELFAMGVDNGYDQQDIVAMSRAWTGWRVQIVDRTQIDNPFAPMSREFGRYPGVGFNAVSNLIGVWTFSFDNTRHGTNRAPILSVWDPNAPNAATNPRPLPGESGKKRYPARFGSPWAGQSYQLVIPPNRTNATAAILDGYDVIRHLSTNLFTAEFLSVKLCRLFVHDDFEHGVYDYTDPNRSREAELIRQCILAWDTPGTGTVGGRGNIRRVVRTILNSELFREHGGTLQKVKTPLEFIASSVRALRSVNPDGTATATTDGYAFISPLSRMGVMSLFNRAEPDGYPEYGASWISAGTLAERVRFVQSLCTDPGFPTANGGRPSDAGNNIADPVALLQKKVPANQLLNAAAVADYFLGIIFPGEGRANLDQYRARAIAFLNDPSADVSPNTNAFAQLTVSNATTSSYDVRVRGMVAFLLTTQRFQEQ